MEIEISDGSIIVVEETAAGWAWVPSGGLLLPDELRDIADALEAHNESD